MYRRRAAIPLLAAGILIGWAAQLAAHAGLTASDPIAGAALGDTPALIRLTFSEKPEATFSEIRVVDTTGQAFHIGRPSAATDDSLALTIHVRPLPAGVYTVSWRVASAVDGHASSGAFVFGVRADPAGAAPAAAAAAAATGASRLEMVARAMWLVGVVLLIGAASSRFITAAQGREVAVGGMGAGLALVGVALLGLAEHQLAVAPFSDLLRTRIGQALIWRAVALAGSCALLALSSAGSQSMLRGLALASVLAGVWFHVAAGHAAAQAPWALVAVCLQWAHVAATGIWLGGLATLMASLSLWSNETRGRAIRRFSRVAAAGLLVVVVTAALRTLNELRAWQDLVATVYGRAIAIKIVLIAAIAALGAYNRWRAVPRAATDSRPLRRAAIAELALASAALLAAAVLGAATPPAAARGLLPGLDITGADANTTVRVRLTAASAQAGPNRFVVRATDYDSGAPISARRVSLRFEPIDESGVAPTSLALPPSAPGTYAGAGANLAFDGRWRITVLLEQPADSIVVPLEIEARRPTQFVSIQRTPGRPPMYTVEVPGFGHVRFSPEPAQAGRATVFITCFTTIYEPHPVTTLVATAASGSAPLRAVPTRRLDRHRFAAEVELVGGLNRLAVVGRSENGTRVRAVVTIDVPAH